MKDLLYVFLSILIISCTSTPQKNEDTKIGYEILKSGERVPLNAVDLSTIKVWEKYVTAHNNKDLETIKNLNQELANKMNRFYNDDLKKFNY